MASGVEMCTVPKLRHHWLHELDQLNHFGGEWQRSTLVHKLCDWIEWTLDIDCKRDTVVLGVVVSDVG